MVFGQRQYRAAGRQVADDRRPRLTSVHALEQVRGEVGVLVILQNHVDGVRVVLRSNDSGDERAVRHAGEFVHHPPILAAIKGHLQQAIVGPGIDQPLGFGRFREGGDVAEERRGPVFEYRLRSTNLAEHRQCVAVELAGQVGGHRHPRVAAIFAPEDAVGGEVQPRCLVRADDER